MMLNVEKSWIEICIMPRSCGPVIQHMPGSTVLRSRRSKVRLLPGTPSKNSRFYGVFPKTPPSFLAYFLLLFGAKNTPKAPLYWWKIGGVGFGFSTDFRPLASGLVPA